MATVFQPIYTKRDKRGRKTSTRTRCWYARYLDLTSKRYVVRTTKTPDRPTAEQLAAQWERESHRRSVGLEAPPADPRSVEQHIRDYLADLAARDRSRHYVGRVGSVLRRLAQGLNWTTLAALDGTELVRWLAARRGPRFGAATANDYLTQVKIFTRWLRRRDRLTTEPFADLAGFATATDRRRVRRPLTPEELARLVAATRARPEYPGSLRGPRRACLYIVAAFTGLRASELASLTTESVRLDADPPTVTVAAGFSKRRREDVLPLHPEAAAAVEELLATTAPGAKLWPGRWAKDGLAARRMRGDLKAAGIAYKNARGEVCDFHSLRLVFVTSLALAGVPLQTAQKLARHSTPTLTSNVYTRLGLTDLAAAVGRIGLFGERAAG